MVISSNIYFHPYLGEWYNLRSIFFKWCGQNPWTHQEYQPQTIASWCFISSLAGSISNQGTNFLTAGPSPLLWSSQALGKISKGSRVDPIVAEFQAFDMSLMDQNLENNRCNTQNTSKNITRWDIHHTGFLMLNPSKSTVVESYSILLHAARFCMMNHLQDLIISNDHSFGKLTFFVWKSTFFLMSVSQLLIEHWKQGPWLV